MTTKQKAYLALTGTSILWGTTWVASKIAVQKVPGLQVAGIRQLTAGIILVAFFLLRGQKIPDTKQLLWLTGIGILMFVSSNGLATVSLKYIPSGLSALIAALYPLLVVMIELVFFKNNRIGWLTFTGLLLGIGGIGIVFYDNAFHAHAAGYGFGIAASLASMITWSIATIFIARNRINMNPYNATGWEMLISAVILLTITGISGNHIPVSQIPAKAWLSIAYLVTAGSVLAFAAFIYTMKHLEPSIAALYAYMNPIVAIIVGSLIVGEKLTPAIIGGSLVTLIGVYLVNQSLKKQKAAIQMPDADAI